MKRVICKHCGAINQHHSFQCNTQRKPIKVKIVTKEWKAKQADIKASKPRTKIKPISDKQAKINAAYKVLHKAFMERNPFCVARFEGVCTGQAKELHHCIFGSNKRKHYLNETTFRAVCSECHRHIHDKMDSDELIKLGLRILD